MEQFRVKVLKRNVIFKVLSKISVILSVNFQLSPNAEFILWLKLTFKSCKNLFKIHIMSYILKTIPIYQFSIKNSFTIFKYHH